MNVGHPESKNIVGFPSLFLYWCEIVIVKTRIWVGDFSADVLYFSRHYFAPPAFFEPIRRVRRGTDEEKAGFGPDFAVTCQAQRPVMANFFSIPLCVVAAWREIPAPHDI